MRNVNGAIIHPSLDVSQLNDDELHQKINELTKRLVSASQVFINQEVITQLSHMQNILLNEQSERIEREAYQSQPHHAIIVETEPDMRVAEVKKEQQPKRDETKRRQYVPIILKHWKSSENVGPGHPSKQDDK